MDTEKLISFHEKKAIGLLLAQEKNLSKIFSEFINSSSSILKRYRKHASGNVWTRNTSLEKALEKELVKLHSNLSKAIEEEQITALGYSEAKTKAILENYVKSLSISGLAKSGLLSVRAKGLAEFEKRKFAGMNLSKKVWKITETTKQQIEFYLESGLASGRSAAEISRDVRALLKNPDKRFRRIRDPKTGKLIYSEPMQEYKPGRGQYRSAFKNALRMAATEINMEYRYSDVALWQEKDFITGYEVKLSSQHPVFDICDHMAGKYPKTFIFGGWHPNCICYSVPILLPQKEFVNYLKSGQISSKRKVTDIPPKGKKYFNDMIGHYEKNYNSLPYWVENNFKKEKGVWRPKYK